MSQLDDARRLADGDPTNEAGFCQYCGRGWLNPDPHAPECPWLSMPKIVAVLEAVSALIAVMKLNEDSEASDDLMTTALIALAARYEGIST